MKNTDKGVVIVVPLRWALGLTFLISVVMAYVLPHVVYEVGLNFYYLISGMNDMAGIQMLGFLIVFNILFTVIRNYGDDIVNAIKLTWQNRQTAPAKK